MTRIFCATLRSSLRLCVFAGINLLVTDWLTVCEKREKCEVPKVGFPQRRKDAKSQRRTQAR